MNSLVRRRFALLCATCFGLFLSAHAGAQKFVLDVSVQVDAGKPQDRQYTVTLGKETAIQTTSAHRVVITPTSMSPNSVVMALKLFDAASNKVTVSTTTIAQLDKKATILQVDFRSSSSSLKIDATPHMK